MKKKVGKLIKSKRKKQKLTQEQLASKLNVSASTISNWELNSFYPDENLIPKICEVLKINKKKFKEEKEVKQEIIYFDELNKRKKVFEKIFYYSVLFLIAFVIFSSISTILYNCVSESYYFDVVSIDKKVLEKADKNLEIIKNSTNSKIPSKDKEELVKVLTILSDKLNNYEKQHFCKNNYDCVIKSINLNIGSGYVGFKYDDYKNKNNGLYSASLAAFTFYNKIIKDIDKDYKNQELIDECRNIGKEQSIIISNMLNYISSYKFFEHSGFGYYSNFGYSDTNVASFYLKITEDLIKVGGINE